MQLGTCNVSSRSIVWLQLLRSILVMRSCCRRYNIPYFIAVAKTWLCTSCGTQNTIFLQQKLNSLLQDKGWLFDPIIVQRAGLLCSTSRQLIIAVGQQFTRKSMQQGVGFHRDFEPVSQKSSPKRLEGYSPVRKPAWLDSVVSCNTARRQITLYLSNYGDDGDL